LAAKKLGGGGPNVDPPSGAVVVVALLWPATAFAKPPSRPADQATTSCNLPESNAEALEILSNYYPGYWWDHTDLTIAVQAHPSAEPAQLEAIHDAIATWMRCSATASTT
jgi:hypothetical protein